MSKYYLTYDDAQEICKRYKNFNFSEKQYRIRGFKISTFDYFICGFNDFNKPILEKPNIKAFDMRGVTYVFNKDGSLWNRFLMLPKFFNLNEIEETQYNKIKNKKIKHIAVKDDGSLVSFMYTPDKKIFSKTIGGFDNEQAIESLKILNKNSEHIKWVINILDKGFTPLFEYVSWKNRIVLLYSESTLKLIGIRNNNNGEFIPPSRVDKPKDMDFVNEVKDSLYNLIKRAKVEEDKEGWVILFEDGMMLKIKTLWYFNIHGLMTEHISREDYIIKNYYENKIDDIIAQLDPNKDKKIINFVNTVIEGINNYSNFIDESVDKLYKKLKLKYNNDWNKFATDCYKDKFFRFVKIYDNKEKYNEKKIDFIIKLTYKLQRARQIIEKWKN